MTVSQQKLDKFVEYAEELINLANEFFRNRITCGDEDHLGVMAITFSAKQAEHLISIQILVRERRYADASVIARVMIEGMALLLWSAKAPSDRPRDWRSYALVFDLETLRTKQVAGDDVETEFEEEILQRLTAEGARFLKKDADPKEPDSYKPRWHLGADKKVLTITAILKELGNPVIVDLYGDLSDWIHWNAKGIGGGLKRDGDIVRVNWSANHWGAIALAAGFQALFQTLEILDDHLGLGHKAALDDIRQRYVTELGAA